MHRPEHYREQAQRARRLASMAHQPELCETLRRVAQDFDDVAYDLETGAVENPPSGDAAAASPPRVTDFRITYVTPKAKITYNAPMEPDSGGAAGPRSAKLASAVPYVLILEDVDDIANLLRAELSAQGYIGASRFVPKEPRSAF